MSIRKTLAVLAVVMTTVVPAQADEGLGVATQFAGSIVSSSEALLPGSSDSLGSEQVTGQCTYAGQTTLTGGQMQYEYGGEAVATSTSLSQPELTVIKCTLISPKQGLPGEQDTLTASFGDVACPGGACASAGLVVGWPVRPVKVCISGYAIFGPTPVVTKTIAPACKTSTL